MTVINDMKTTDQPENATSSREAAEGISDVPVWTAFALMLAFVAALATAGLWLLKRGVGLRS